MSQASKPTPDQPEYVDLPLAPTAVVQRRGYPIGRLRELVDVAFTALGQAIEAGRFMPGGLPFIRYDSVLDGDVDLDGDFAIDLEVGFPVHTQLTAPIQSGDERIVPGSLPAGLIARAVHTGPYDDLPSAWQTFTEQIAADGYERALPFWEAYRNMPGPDTDPQTLQTWLATVVTRA